MEKGYFKQSDQLLR